MNAFMNSHDCRQLNQSCHPPFQRWTAPGNESATPAQRQLLANPNLSDDPDSGYAGPTHATPVRSPLDVLLSEIRAYARAAIRSGNLVPRLLLAETPAGRIEFCPDRFSDPLLSEWFCRLSRLIACAHGATAAGIVCPVMNRSPLAGCKYSLGQRRMFGRWANIIGVVAESEERARVKFLRIRKSPGRFPVVQPATGRYMNVQRRQFSGVLPAHPWGDDERDTALRYLEEMGLCPDMLRPRD